MNKGKIIHNYELFPLHLSLFTPILFLCWVSELDYHSILNLSTKRKTRVRHLTERWWALQSLSNSATQQLSNSATQQLSNSATQQLSNSATQQLSNSATRLCPDKRAIFSFKQHHYYFFSSTFADGKRAVSVFKFAHRRYFAALGILCALGMQRSRFCKVIINKAFYHRNRPAVWFDSG